MQKEHLVQKLTRGKKPSGKNDPSSKSDPSCKSFPSCILDPYQFLLPCKVQYIIKPMPPIAKNLASKVY